LQATIINYLVGK